MGALTDMRQQLAEAVTGTGLIDCSMYPPDSVSPPQAFVDNLAISIAQGSSFSFCLYEGTATIVTVAQRNDKAAATSYLEDLTGPILESIEALDGVRITNIDSGSVAGSAGDLPAVVYQIQFGVELS